MPEKETPKDMFLHYTQQAGAIGRHLGVSVIAMIWIISTQEDASLNNNYKWALIFAFSSLGVDLFQYIVGTISWGCLIESDKDFSEHTGVVITLLIFIALKIIAMMLAYLYFFYGSWNLLFPS